jgi:hypothetical protein
MFAEVFIGEIYLFPNSMQPPHTQIPFTYDLSSLVSSDYLRARMVLVLTMLISPARGWQWAARSSHGVLRTLLQHLFPLLLLGCVAEGYSMIQWGKPAYSFGAISALTPAQVITLQFYEFAIGVLVVFACAGLLCALANTFHRRQTCSRALLLSVFGLGPIFLMRLVNAIPAVNPWISWGVGALLAVAVLYEGLPRVFNLDPAHTPGSYFSSSLIIVLVSGLGRLLLALLVKKGFMPAIEL